jgi:phosphatidylglycerophosphatase A
MNKAATAGPLRRKTAFILAGWFGCGLAPKARGTVGSLAALAIAAAAHYFWGANRWHFLAITAAMTLPAIWASSVVEKELGVEDPQMVVVDEVIGQWLALLGAAQWNWISMLLAFGLFRLFDIWKPFPVRQAEQLPGGTGIVADDVMAGIWAALVLWLAGWFNLF